MISRTILGAAAAAFIATGSLAATTGTASATGVYVDVGGYGWGQGHHNKKFCKPIYKKVVWKDRWGHWHKKVKLVDYKCWWPKRHHGWKGGWDSY